MLLALVEGHEMLDVGQLAAGDRVCRLDEEKDRPIQGVVRVRQERRMLTTEAFHSGDERDPVRPRRVGPDLTNRSYRLDLKTLKRRQIVVLPKERRIVAGGEMLEQLRWREER